MCGLFGGRSDFPVFLRVQGRRIYRRDAIPPGNSLPGLYFREEIFMAVLRNYVEMLIDSLKFKNIMIVNGHGGENHLYVIDRLKKEFAARRNVRIIHVMPILNFPQHKWSHAAVYNHIKHFASS